MPRAQATWPWLWERKCQMPSAAVQLEQPSPIRWICPARYPSGTGKVPQRILCDKEIWPNFRVNFPVRFALKPLFYWVVPSNYSENSLVFVRFVFALWFFFFGCGFFAYSWKLPAYNGAFSLTVDNFSFFTYSWSFFAYNFSFFAYSWSFLAYGGKVRLIRA